MLKVNEVLKTQFNKTEMYVRKYSPEILTGAGVVGVVATTVIACKATLKVNDILDEYKTTIENIEKVKTMDNVDYTEEDEKKDRFTLTVQTGVKLVKLYLPAASLGLISISCLVQSNRILKKRNAALSAAYMTLDKSFKKYRENVKERFGEEVDKEMRYSIKTKKITEVDENGNEVEKEIKTIDPDDPSNYSDYARFFDEASPYWSKDPEYNLVFLKAQQQYANDILVARGRIFLNEVYDMLGIPKTKAGQVVGWVYDPKHPVGDNYVDFGIYDLDKERVRRFVNGDERNILLDFNVDGNIWELM